MVNITETKDKAAEKERENQPAWVKTWWKLMDFDIGIIPLPVYLVLVILMIGFTAINGITKELAMVIAIAATFAFTLGEIGNRLPLLRNIGGGAVLVTFVPSLLGYLGWIPQAMTDSVGEFFKTSKILNLFIAAVIVGSILSMDRSLLIKGFLKIFAPLAAGTVCAGIVGTGVGVLMGLDLHQTFFYIVVPIMAGGVGEGAIPLTIGYSQILGHDQGEMLAKVMPAIMVGNLTAVILAGLLANLGNRLPHLSGNGVLQPGAEDLLGKQPKAEKGCDIRAVAAAAILAVMLYLVGVLMHDLLKWPAPVVMLFLAVLLMLCHLISPRIQAGSAVVYKFALTAMAFPILFTFSLVLTPWESLIAGFAPANLITIVATVLAMVTGGFFTARFVNLYPVEAAIVTSTHSGMGGAGDIAILTASNRMRLMPFAQIATRIGGGITVAVALIMMHLMY